MVQELEEQCYAQLNHRLLNNAIFIAEKNILPRYLYYVVKYMHLEKYFTGATIPHIYFKDYKNETFNLEALERQKEIVTVLENVKE